MNVLSLLENNFNLTFRTVTSTAKGKGKEEDQVTQSSSLNPESSITEKLIEDLNKPGSLELGGDASTSKSNKDPLGYSKDETPPLPLPPMSELQLQAAQGFRRQRLVKKISGYLSGDE